MTARRRTWGANREGEAAADLIVILNGTVEVTKRVSTGPNEQRIIVLGEGTTLGEMTLVSRGRRSATARAMTPARVGVLSAEHLEQAAGRWHREQRCCGIRVTFPGGCASPTRRP